MTDYVLKNLDKFAFVKKEPNRSLIITDIDGTISEIAPTSGEAVVETEMKKAVSKLAEKYRVAVITGRTITEAKAMLSLDNLVYLGNHGLEKIIDGRVVKPDSAADREAIEKALALTGPLKENHRLLVEDKGLSLAVHYRRAKNPAAAASDILDLLEPLSSDAGLRIIKGKMVIELKSKLSDKGKAVEELVLESGADRVVYIGDDQTDLDAFKAIKTLSKGSKIRGLSLAVNSGEIPPPLKEEADFILDSVNEVRLFFLWLIESAPPLGNLVG